ncbi:Alsin [Dirofilaria immitis]
MALAIIMLKRTFLREAENRSSDEDSKVSKCVSQFAPAGDSHISTTDDLSAFVYVTLRAQLQRLGVEIRLIEDFAPQL